MAAAIATAPARDLMIDPVYAYGTEADSRWLTGLHLASQAPQWNELGLTTQLTVISREWLLRRTHGSQQMRTTRSAVAQKPLTIPKPTPKRSRRLPSSHEHVSLGSEDLIEHTLAEERAQCRTPTPHEEQGCPTSPSDSPQRRRRQEDSLFSPMIPESYCDFASEDGFIQRAKKKKNNNNKPAQPVASNAPEKKDQGGAGDGGDKSGGDKSGGDQNGGAGESGGGDAGKGDDDKGDKKDNKKDDKKGDNDTDKKDVADEPTPNDNWASFATVGKKAKGKKQTGATDLLGTETKFDAFDDIKLNDTGPSLDLDFGNSAADSKTNMFSTFGSTWNTGTTLDWPGTTTADKTKDKEEKRDDLATDTWSLDRPKPKKKNKTTFGFGSFDETEEKAEESLIQEDKPEEKKDDEFGFGFVTAGKSDKKKKKTSIWGAEPDFEEKKDPLENQDAGSAAADNTWGGWGSSTKKKGKKDVASFLDPTPEPQNTEPADDFWGDLDTKSKKKSTLDDISEPTPPEPASEPLKTENIWDEPWGTNKKDKKKKGVLEETKEPDPEPDPEPAGDVGWGWGVGTKNKKKGKIAEPEPAKEETPTEDKFWDDLSTSKDKPAPAPVKESSSAWNFWGATKNTSKKTKEQPPAESTVVESARDSWINWGKKDQKNDSIEEPQNDDAWGWDSSKKSPPPAPTPPTLDMDEMDNNVWDDPQAGGEPDPAAAALAAEIAAEENELSELSKKSFTKKLSRKDQKRLDELTKRASGRADEAAAKAAEEQARREAEAAAEALKAEQEAAAAALKAEQEAAADAIKAEIELEEAELETLKEKLLKRKKKFAKTDKARMDELEAKISVRAAAAAEADIAADNEDAQAAIEAEQAAREAEEQATREAEERAARETEEAEAQAEAARVADEKAAQEAEETAKRAAAEEAELATLKEKSKKKRKFAKNDQVRMEELEKIISARVAAAAAAIDVDIAADNGDSQNATEAAEQAAHEADEQAAREAEEAASREAAEQAALEAEAAVAREAEEAAAREADEKAAREAKEKAALEAEIAADKKELAALKTKLKIKGKLLKKEQKRMDELIEKINPRVDTADADKAAAEEQAAREVEEQAAREAEEQAREAEEQAAREGEEQAAREAEEQAREAEERSAREAEEQAAREAEEKAALEAEIAADEKELAALETKLQKRGKLLKKEQKRMDELTEKINARNIIDATPEADHEAAQAAIEAAERTAREVEEQAAREAEEAAAREAEEKAAREAEEQAAREAEEAAQAAREAEERAERERQEAEAAASSKKKSKKSSKTDDKKSKSSSKEKKKENGDDFDIDNVDLTAEQADEILSGLAPPKKPKVEDPFSFWGAKPVPKSSPPEAVQKEAILDDTKPAFSNAIDDWMPKKKTKASKLAEKLKKFEPAAPDNFEGDLIDVLPEAAAPPPPPPQLGASQGDDDVLPGSFPMTDEDHEDEFHETHETQEFHESEEFPGNEFHDEFHDREFHDYERDYEAHDDDVKGKGVMVAEERRRGVPKEDREGQDEDEIVEIIDLSPPVEKKSKKSRKGKSKDAAQIPVPPAVPPPPPAVPEVPPAPPSPPVEPKSSRKERAKINRDGGASWGMWSASTTPLKEEKKSSKSRSDGKRPKKVREEKVSSKGSGSDKAERQDPGVAPASRSRINSLFQSTPPLSRSMSTRDKQSRKSSSRRHSVEMSGGLVSPPPEEMPEMASRAARVMGVDKSRSRRTSRMRTPAEDDDIVMVGTRDLASSPDKSGRKRSKVRLDDDIVMVDVGGPADGTPLRRSNSSAKKGISGLFGGLMSSTPRPEPRRRSTYHGTDDEGRPDKRARRSRGMSNAEPDMDADREARRAARRELREQEKAEEARRAKEARRERRKRQEEDEEDARRQEEREARRAERRVAREREAQRLAGEEAEAKEAERMERRRQRRIEKEAAAVEEAEADARRAAREERRRARHVEGSEEEEHRRLRREAKRAEKSSRSRPTPVDEYGYPRERPPRPPTDDEYGKRRTPTWPHSGTSSWVKEHSDAGPPPDDGHTTDAPQPIDDEEARRAARRAARRRERNGDASREQQQHEDDQRRRRARREERERRERRVGGSDGSGDKAQREAVFMDSTPRSSWWRKLTGS